MATAKQLLLSSTDSSGESNRLIISEDLRTITVPRGQEVLGVYGDDKVRRLWFDMPSVCDGTDLSECQVSINYSTEAKDEGREYADHVSVADGVMSFSWLVGRGAFRTWGWIDVAVCLRKFASDGKTVEKEFNTTPVRMQVLRGIEADVTLTDAEVDQVNAVIGPCVAATNEANAAAARVESAVKTTSAAAAQSLDAAANARSVTAAAAKTVDDALSTLDSTTQRAEAAIAVVGDVSRQSVPLMSADTRGGAALGTGLKIVDGALTLDSLGLSASGESVTCEDAADAPMLGLSVDGESVQASTVGKNLLELSIATQTINGVTITNNGDGTLTVNGTATGNIYRDITSAALTLPDGTYTLSGCPSGGSTSTYDLVWPSNGYDIGNGFTKTNPTSARVQMEIRTGSVCNNIVFKPQLEIGSTATSYEPYTGGAPSPSPDYPQEIACVRGVDLSGYGGPAGGCIGVRSRSRNLLEYDGTYSTGYYTFIKRSEREIVATKIKNGGVFFARYFAHIESPGTYVFSSGEGSNGKIYIYTDSLWGNSYKSFTTNVSPIAIQFDTPGDYVVGAYSDAPSNTRVSISCPQLESGTAATPYVPYHHSVTPIDLKGHELHGLPDGTHDELAIDAAGHVELVKRCGATDRAATDGVSATVGVTALSTTGALADGADVVYKLAAPQTIDLGYIDMPQASDGATVEVLAEVTPGMSARWWTAAAQPVSDALQAIRTLAMQTSESD